MELIEFLLVCAFVIPGILLFIQEARKHKLIITDRLADIFRYVDTTNAEYTVIALDIDNTLAHLAAPDCFGTAEWYEYEARERLRPGVSINDAYMPLLPIFDQAIFDYDMELVEPDAAAIVRQLQNAGALVIGVTGRNALVAERTAEQLQQLGIDFANNILPASVILDRKDDVVYQYGIIFCNPLGNKGHYIKELLGQRIGQSYSRIIAVDDNWRFVVQMVTKFATFNESICIRYSRLDEHVARYDAKRDKKAREQQK